MRELATEAPTTLAAILPPESVPVLGPLLLTFVGTRPSSITASRTETLKTIAERWRLRYERNLERPGLVLRRGENFVVLTIRDIETE